MVRLLLRIAVTVSIVNLAGIGAISLGDVSPALAGGAPPTNCADTSPPSGSTVDGNLIVKGKNGFCDLVDVHVTGNVTVYAGDSLVTDGVTQIDGKLTSKGGQFIQICESDIQGNVKITGTVSGEFGGIEIGGVDCGASGGSDIFGSLTVEKNSAPDINIVGNTVGNGSGHGSITVSNNVAVAGSTDKVSDNMFYGKLKCVGNNPPPTGLGNSNPAHLPGVGTGQCAGLIV